MFSRTRQCILPIAGSKRLIRTITRVFLLLMLFNGAAEVDAQGSSSYDIQGSSYSFDTQGPTFAVEPINRLEFTNNVGSTLDCSARGNPIPSVEWFDEDNNPITTITKLRHILANSSLYFPPFEPVAFRQDVHWSVYRCIATSNVGTIVSRDVTVKAVVNQLYEPEVQNPGGFLGSNVLIKCNIPSFVKEYVRVTSWLQEPSFNIYPSLESDGKYHMLPSGELLLINITRMDAQRTYRCRTHHQLTQQAVVSSNVGRIQLTEMREPVPPIMNEKSITVTVRLDESLVIPCVAYASPSPTYRWHRRKTNQEESIEGLLATGRLNIRYGTLIFMTVKRSDNGLYFCTATNTEGSETLEVQISVIAPLSAYILPGRQTVDLGKSAELKCSVTGFPQQSLFWLKDGQPLRTGSRVRLLSKEHIKITSITKEDKGMYQCFVKNDVDSAQGAAELKLGEVAPQLVYKFIEQTMQPGPGASLKCSATGNPTPQITWTLDGFPLPNNDRLMIGQYVTMYGDVVSHVNISAVKSEDGGEYECIAKSRAGNVVHSAKLNIYGLPYVRPMPAISAVAGKTLTIKCPVAGYPIDTIVWEKVPPKITPFSFARDLNVGDRTSIQCVVATGDLPLTFTWLKDDQPVLLLNIGIVSQTVNNMDNKQSFGVSDDYLDSANRNDVDGKITVRQNDDFTSALSITSVTRAQGGTYTCRVENDAATVTHAAQLRVNVPPRISPFSFEDGITEGMRTQLLCSSSQGDQPLNISWLRNGKQINLNGARDEDDEFLNINDYGPFSSILLIHNVTSKHNGNYTCQIKNRAGIVEYTAFLSVAVPPRWVIEPQDQSAVLGNAVIITCKADGFPLPTVHWKQALGEQTGEYRELSYSTGTSGIESHSNGSLIIPKVVQEHEGNFLCQASNGIGAGLSKLIKLTVHVGPNVTVPLKQISVRRGDRVTLRCEAAGDQPLDVSWRAKGNRIDPTYDIRYNLKNSPINKGTISELTVVQTTLADRGEYSCVASNAYGHDHAAIHLQVLEPPNFPRNLHVIELNSRSVTLAWQPNDQDTLGNYRESQPITSYRLQYKEGQDVWHDHNIALVIPGERTTAHVNNLKPATSYHFRLYAENNLGSSGPSDILHVQTDSEVPNGPPLQVKGVPLSSQQLLITWRPPDRESWNGELLGYTIGWKRTINATDIWNYTKVGIPGGEGYNDFRLTGLEKFTNYSITVSTFNIKGDGPNSFEQVVCTLEDVPSAAPTAIKCEPLTSASLIITWKPPPDEFAHGIIRTYRVTAEPDVDSIEYTTRQTKIVLDGLQTTIHSLSPWTNYTIQVLASTQAGDGIPSLPITCNTSQAVPDAPERLKTCSKSNSSAVISWMPPRRPNGIITKYSVYIRDLEKGQEVGMRKVVINVSNVHHFEAENLTITHTYEAWIVAATTIGDGPTTPVVKLMPSPSVSVPAAIISFGQNIKISQREDLKLACLTVGFPPPVLDWKPSTSSKTHFRPEVDPNHTLILRNVQRSYEGNYTCIIRNAFGTDRIVYNVVVMVPPSPPNLSAFSSGTSTVSLHWNVSDDGSTPLTGYILSYRQEFENWEQIRIDRHSRSHLLENLHCGTSYEFHIIAINKIGSSEPSRTRNARTKGQKPISPLVHNLLRPNVTSVILELANWEDGGCPIIYFSVQILREPNVEQWVMLSNNISPQTRYPIADLHPAHPYKIRVTAHNKAGATVADYSFDTLDAIGRSVKPTVEQKSGIIALIDYSHMLGISIITFFTLILVGVGIWFCIKNHRISFGQEGDSNQPQMIENKNQLNEQQEQQQHREQFYATVRKPSSQQSPRESEVGLERIPEYSEDIYPYATFHLPDHENQSGNPARKGCLYNSRDNTLTNKGKRSDSLNLCNSSGLVGGSTSVGNVCGSGNSSNIGTEKRYRRKSKGAKSESEEYDSLNSDSDISAERGVSSRTESSSHLEDTGPISFTSHAHSPGSRTNKERLSVFTRPPLHKNKYINRDYDIFPEPLQTFDLLHAKELTCDGSNSREIPGFIAHRRNSSMGNRSLDMPITHRDFDPPPKQHHQHQQPQQQQEQQQAQNTATPITASPIHSTTTSKINWLESKLPSPYTSQSNSYVEILKNCSYQNLMQKYGLLMPISANSSSRLNNVTTTTVLANSKNPKNTVLNGPTLKILEMHETSSSLNKNYGDFLTITPRRRGRLLKSLNSTNPFALNTSVSCNNSTIPDRYQHHVLEPEYKETESLHLSGSQSDCTTGKPYDYRTMETICNADTLKLESDSYLRSKYKNSTISSNNDSKIINDGYEIDFEGSQSGPINSTAGINKSFNNFQTEKLRSIIGYANTAHVNPPSAFSDIGKAHSLINLVRQDKHGNGTKAGTRYVRNGADNTIAV